MINPLSNSKLNYIATIEKSRRLGSTRNGIKT